MSYRGRGGGHAGPSGAEREVEPERRELVLEVALLPVLSVPRSCAWLPLLSLLASFMCVRVDDTRMDLVAFWFLADYVCVWMIHVHATGANS